jgi:hypothetical protein
MVNAWGVDSGLRLDVHSVDLGLDLQMLDIYKPYMDNVPFWDNLFNKSFITGDSLILGGELNCSLGAIEIWGPRAREDSLADYFTQKLISKDLIDIEPIKMKPSWSNKRVGED